MTFPQRKGPRSAPSPTPYVSYPSDPSPLRGRAYPSKFSSPRSAPPPPSTPPTTKKKPCSTPRHSAKYPPQTSARRGIRNIPLHMLPSARSDCANAFHLQTEHSPPDVTSPTFLWSSLRPTRDCTDVLRTKPDRIWSVRSEYGPPPPVGRRDSRPGAALCFPTWTAPLRNDAPICPPIEIWDLSQTSQTNAREFRQSPWRRAFPTNVEMTFARGANGDHGQTRDRVFPPQNGRAMFGRWVRTWRGRGYIPVPLWEVDDLCRRSGCCCHLLLCPRFESGRSGL
mmetsp:Transcript_38992/g.81610  ORF Transcript_38992/g.81610 Transcript_38992/m.81610 type:complete len:282 (+) Transcript_38992:270-1115(+)